MALGPQNSFIWGSGGVPMTPSEIEAQRKVANAMMTSGMDFSPVASPWQGAARVAQAMLGGFESKQADQAAKTNAAAEAQLLEKYAPSIFGTPAPTASAPSAVSTPMGHMSIPVSSGATVPNDSNAVPGTVGMNQRLADLSQDFIQDNPGTSMSSGFRSNADQARLYADRGNNPNPVAPPGSSNHERGLAVDIAGMTPGQRALLPQYGLAQPVPNDPPHVQLAADPAALPANSQPTQGFAVPGQSAAAAPSVNPSLLRARASPYISDGTKKILDMVIMQQMKTAHDAADPLHQLQIQTAQKALGKSDAPASVQEYEYYKSNLPDGQQPMDYSTWSTAKARAGATTVNNNIGGGSDKQVFDTFAENTKEARAAATGLTALRNARQALQGPGGAITGFGADSRLTFQKMGAALGVTDPSAIQNTETFRAAIAPQVAAMLKSTVGTNQISNSDREFAEKAAGGSIQLDAGSINRLLGIMENAGTARLQLHQQQLDAVYPDPERNRRERALFSVNVPTAPAPPAPTPDRSAIEAEMKRRGLL